MSKKAIGSIKTQTGKNEMQSRNRIETFYFPADKGKELQSHLEEVLKAIYLQHDGASDYIVCNFTVSGENDKVSVTVYTSNKIVIQGRNSDLFGAVLLITKSFIAEGK